MTDDLKQFVTRLRDAIRDLRSRVRRAIIIRGVATLLAAMVGTALLQLTIDRWFHLTVDQRVILNILITIVWAFIAYRYLIRPLTRPLTDSQVASWVDRANPNLHDLTKTAIEFAQAPQQDQPNADVSAELVALTLADAKQQLDRTAFDRVVDDRRSKRNRNLAIAAGVVAVLPWLILPGLMQVWFARNWFLRDINWPQETYIDPQGFDATNRLRMARGDQLTIEAIVRGEMPRLATLEWRTRDGISGRQNMTRTGRDRLRTDLGILTKELEFRITGNDERTKAFTIVPVERPRITDSQIRVTPPAYTNDDPQEFERQANIEMLSGAEVDMTVRLNKQVRTAALRDADGNEVGTTTIARDADTGAPIVTTNITDPLSGSFVYDFRDSDDITNLNPVRFVFRVTPDEPPAVDLTATAVSDVVTPIATIPVQLAIADTFGITAADLTAQRNTQAPRTLLTPDLPTPKRRIEESSAVTVADLEVRPGDQLRLKSAALDNDPAGPNLGTSRDLDFRVISLEDFRLVMAQRELELRTEFERLLAGQRSIRAELQQVLASLGAEVVPAAREARRFESLARKQSSYGTRCGSFAQRYQALIDEMRVNKVGRVADERRVVQRIARPLTTLQRDTIPAAARTVRDLATAARDTDRTACLNLQDQILRELLFVYQNMLEGEGYRDVLATLEEIISGQEKINQETEAAVSDLLDDILGLSDPTGGSPAPIE